MKKLLIIILLLFSINAFGQVYIKGTDGYGEVYSSSERQKVFYVRPLGGDYGSEDGTTYTNAWDGFVDIVWDSLTPNSLLYVCGSHTGDSLYLGASNITVSFNYPFDYGSMYGNNTVYALMHTNGKTNISVYGDTSRFTFRKPTNSGFLAGNSTSNNIKVYYVWSDSSGNQAFQTEWATVTYYGCKGSNSVDDGLSLHGGNVTSYGCLYYGNDEGVNSTTGIFTAENCIFKNNNKNIATGVVGSIFTINNSLIYKGSVVASFGTINIDNCVFDTVSFYTASNGELNIDNTLIIGNSNYNSKSGTTNMNYCLIKSNYSSTANILSVLGSNLYTNYCIFVAQGDIYQISKSTGECIINNCNFIGISNVGRGTYSINNLELNNCIFYDLKNGLVSSGDTTWSDYDNIYDVTTPVYVFGNGANIRTNSITGNPNLTDVANLDFRLGDGSVCIGAGKDLGTEYSTGIYTANWGNRTTLPVITYKTQGTNWDIGAYVK